ncbi:hypothetical protein [Nostoc sp. NMS8]|uniref:hypothetical protein n=1 Tax=Nostoc sp. NMS8 TaxID=2815392 RepID=UPI0025E637A3|nr:hypothetical protein [Nostoc sp. NMS8]MBN3958040.1 hypothetical protein [Nostoc sp. NMS8]
MKQENPAIYVSLGTTLCAIAQGLKSKCNGQAMSTTGYSALQLSKANNNSS